MELRYSPHKRLLGYDEGQCEFTTREGSTYRGEILSAYLLDNQFLFFFYWLCIKRKINRHKIGEIEKWILLEHHPKITHHLNFDFLYLKQDDETSKIKITGFDREECVIFPPKDPSNLVIHEGVYIHSHKVISIDLMEFEWIGLPVK